MPLVSWGECVSSLDLGPIGVVIHLVGYSDTCFLPILVEVLRMHLFLLVMLISWNKIQGTLDALGGLLRILW